MSCYCVFGRSSWKFMTATYQQLRFETAVLDGGCIVKTVMPHFLTVVFGIPIAQMGRYCRRQGEPEWGHQSLTIDASFNCLGIVSVPPWGRCQQAASFNCCHRCLTVGLWDECSSVVVYACVIMYSSTSNILNYLSSWHSTLSRVRDPVYDGGRLVKRWRPTFTWWRELVNMCSQCRWVPWLSSGSSMLERRYASCKPNSCVSWQGEQPCH